MANFKYIIVKCTELSDQWECDFERTLVCATNKLEKYRKYKYEIYEILSNGKLKCIQEYDTIPSDKSLYFCIHNPENIDEYVLKKVLQKNIDKSEIDFKIIQKTLNKYNITSIKAKEVIKELKNSDFYFSDDFVYHFSWGDPDDDE